MARMVMHRAPVSVFRPGTSISVGMFRGKELADDDPFCLDPAFGWLFEDGPDPGLMTSVRIDGAPPVESGTARPGEKRNTRRGTQ